MKRNKIKQHPEEVDRLLQATHDDPFRFLGPHKTEEGWVVRVFQPEAAEVVVAAKGGRRRKAKEVHPQGLFEASFPGDQSPGEYRLHFRNRRGDQWKSADPYAFPSQLGEMDLYLFGEGNHFKIYEKLGAHTMNVDGVEGVHFAVWAPNARRVSLVGDFNQWDGRIHPMRRHPNAGVWEIFIPGLQSGAHYKFEVLGADQSVVLKGDPYAFFSQNQAQTASLVYDLTQYQWNDQEWMTRREQTDWLRSPVNIYEVHLGSWARVESEGNRYLTYSELADRLLDYVVDMGYTHIELLPVAEHPFDGSWGYQITAYYAPTSRFSSPDEFRALVDRAHQRGIGVILDWVPGHFPKDQHGLARFDGTHLYEHADPRQGEQRDWGTLIFNYGRNEVRNFLVANGLFWLEQYHIDGLRVDAVASMLYLDYSRKPGEWVPNVHGGRENLEAIDFLKQFNEVCYDRFPGVMTVAEESTAWPGVSRPTYVGGLGFGFKWNMGWMHDFLNYMSTDPVFRRYHQGDVTFSLLYAFTENFVLVLSHDEVVHGKGSLLGKMPGDQWQKFANLRLFLAWMITHPGKKLLFQGGEFGQPTEWNHDASLPWHLLDQPEHAGVRRMVQHLNFLYRTEPALHELDDRPEGFEWVDFHDSDNSVVSFLRRSADGDQILVVVNATPQVLQGYRVGVPEAGFYEEILNSDAGFYGGSNVGNQGGVPSDDLTWQGRPYSVQLTLPPLACLAFRWQPSGN